MSDAELTSFPAIVLDQFQLAPVGLDDWSDVRHLHRISFSKLVAPWLRSDQAEVFCDYVETPEYVNELLSENLVVGWFDGHLVATCGWRPSDDTGTVARLSSLYVHPLFTRMGFGRSILRYIEERAAASGFRSFMVRSTAGSLGIFAASGYDMTSQGVAALVPGVDMPSFYLRKTLRPLRSNGQAA